MKVSIFLFHRVNDSGDPLWPPMTSRRFFEVTRYIANNYTVVGLTDICDFINGRTILSKKPLAAITFDDGYKDNIEFAAPILNKHGLTATFFVVTSCIDQGRATWTYIIDQLLTGTRTKKINLESVCDPDLQFANLATLKERAKYSSSLKSHLKSMDDSYRSIVLEEIKSQLQDVKMENPMMNWSNIRELITGGFSVGSHTVNHPPLATLKEEEQIRFELAFSRQRITDETGIAPFAIAYPVGSYDMRTTRLSEETGYSMGMIVEHKVSSPNKENRFAIPRLELYQENKLKNWLRMHGMQQKFKNLISK